MTHTHFEQRYLARIDIATTVCLHSKTYSCFYRISMRRQCRFAGKISFVLCALPHTCSIHSHPDAAYLCRAITDLDIFIARRFYPHNLELGWTSCWLAGPLQQDSRNYNTFQHIRIVGGGASRYGDCVHTLHTPLLRRSAFCTPLRADREGVFAQNLPTASPRQRATITQHRCHHPVPPFGRPTVREALTPLNFASSPLIYHPLLFCFKSSNPFPRPPLVVVVTCLKSPSLRYTYNPQTRRQTLAPWQTHHVPRPHTLRKKTTSPWTRGVPTSLHRRNVLRRRDLLLCHRPCEGLCPHKSSSSRHVPRGPYLRQRLCQCTTLRDRFSSTPSCGPYPRHTLRRLHLLRCLLRRLHLLNCLLRCSRCPHHPPCQSRPRHLDFLPGLCWNHRAHQRRPPSRSRITLWDRCTCYTSSGECIRQNRHQEPLQSLPLSSMRSRLPFITIPHHM
jgi:hypothetical protein